jgi:hypothetical protein
MWATAVIKHTVITIKNTQGEGGGAKFAESGVDVMITIFCDFCQIFGEKNAVFL